MRRKNREITDMNQIREIVEECMVCRMGLNDKGKVYIVPMNFGCEFGGDRKITFYFHCSKVGRKMEILKENPEVCLELDGRHELMSADSPCGHSYFFASLIGNGTAEIVEDAKEKEQILKVIMKYQTGKDFSEFDEKWVNAVGVLKVELTDYEVKQNSPGMK